MRLGMFQIKRKKCIKHKSISAIVAAVSHITTPPPPHTHSCPLKNNECVTPLDVGVNAHADALLFSFKPQDSSQVESSTKENETVEIVNEKSFGVKYSLIPCSHSLHLFCHLCVSNCESPVAGSCLIKSEA